MEDGREEPKNQPKNNAVNSSGQGGIFYRKKKVVQRNNNGKRSKRKTTTTARMAFAILFLLLPLTNGQQYELFQLFQNPRQPQIHQQQQQTIAGTESVSIRLIDEILEIFVPPEKFGSKRKEEMAIPSGLNRLLPRTARSRDLRSKRMEETESLSMERRFSPIRENNNGAGESEQQAPWANLARQLLGVFQAIDTTTPPTTTTTTTEMSLLEKIMPKLLSPFGLGTTAPPPTAPPLFPFFSKSTTPPNNPFLSFFRQEQPKREEIVTNPLVEPVARLFGVEKKAVEEGRAQIDTGGTSFDRLVVREKIDPDNPLTAIIGGAKWNERGIKWDDGNIRLVNKNGNSFLGSEVGVNDRSVDIPLKRWLDIANGFVNFNQAQQERVRRW